MTLSQMLDVQDMMRRAARLLCGEKETTAGMATALQIDPTSMLRIMNRQGQIVPPGIIEETAQLLRDRADEALDLANNMEKYLGKVPPPQSSRISKAI